MERIGRVIRMPITKRNGMQIATIEYDTPEADLCSIKSTDTRSGCSGCGGGCHACGGSGKDGLLVVQGNIVDALNVSGTRSAYLFPIRMPAFRGCMQSVYRFFSPPPLLP